MTVRVELLSALRRKAGAESLSVELGEVPSAGVKPSVLLALQALQTLPGAEGLGLLEGRQVKKGVLVFVRSAEGTLHRVFHPDAQGLAAGQTLVLAAVVEGG